MTQLYPIVRRRRVPLKQIEDEILGPVPVKVDAPFREVTPPVVDVEQSEPDSMEAALSRRDRRRRGIA